ncbi:MAG: 1-deoxy-D-xylulose-5-phosphate reductoisomerase [Clostridiales bacterium]|uniref:1-deoxy-D-xylulose-5-phosphate reductoisomerase n=1 Tax=Clostridium sp. N3C TaxID=1776758 RepID=UPI00092E138A|nr:1-deoxy-D-xylulose-5-phosphate reductoisomerase [Clostridium sp. N3C]NLZ48196.1 1-deoxy-D-xylulose-5-phosphate reductoisomerase [Clostridiales bacterium]SCN21925.1 1-deoxy-D-xylulose 5-phosphate reductoisomerase [Clostridium sp. N3C]
MKNITLLGATGSIGTQTLDVIRQEKDKFKLIAISAYRSLDKMVSIINEFEPKYAVLMEEDAYNKLKDYCENNKRSTQVLFGMDGLIEIAAIPEVDIVVTALVGMVGIQPTLKAIENGKDIALANKETLVAAGQIVMEKARTHNVNIFPVDSEHSAIFQCLQGNSLERINKIILTASGGPFRGKKFEDLQYVKKEAALKHPNWSMGKKISIDSATLMNKGLEIIEAHWLFNQPYEKIEPIVHPESIIHSAIEYTDGSIIAQLGNADMRLPIQYALNYPNRGDMIVESLDLTKIAKLTFEKPDYDNFPCLKLAIEAGKCGGLMPTILNSSNESAVDLYLKDRINFGQIYSIINECMNKFDYTKECTVENILLTQRLVSDYITTKYL